MLPVIMHIPAPNAVWFGVWGAEPPLVLLLATAAVGYALAVRAARRAGRATATADAFELTSSNVGPPLPAADVAGLFKPYFRPATNSKSSGLGLGLYIVSEIAKAHRGTATASAERGELTFTVRIPRHA